MDMKDSCALTLFRRLGAFAGRVTLAISVIGVITPASAGATDYRAGVFCPPPSEIPPLSQRDGSPTPVVAAGGTKETGGIVRAAAEVTAEVHAFAPAPHAFSRGTAGCGVGATVNLDDVVIQGPPGPVQVKLHLPFHANITQDFTEMTDGTNVIHSAAPARLFFLAEIDAASASVDVLWNRQSPVDTPVILSPAQFPFGASDFVPKPRIPGLTPLDPGGFVTQFFQRTTPVTGQVGVPFAGLNTSTIDELRGEIILTKVVQANNPFRLHLVVSHNVDPESFFIMSAFSTIAEARLSIPTDGSPVFELPDGYTAQIPSAGVIDNVVPQVFKCTQTVASWRSHPGDWPLEFMTLGGETYTRDDLLGILQLQPNALRPDASVVLAQQLIAARLNEANESAPGPMLVPSMSADSLILASGKLPSRVNPATATGQQMMNLAIVLNNYNAGRLTAACVP